MILVAAHIICLNFINEQSFYRIVFMLFLAFFSVSCLGEMLAISLGQVKQYRMYFFGLSVIGPWILGKFIHSFLMGIPVLNYDGKPLRIERKN